MTKEELIEDSKRLDQERAAKKTRKTLTQELKDELELQQMLHYDENPITEEEFVEEIEREWDVSIGEKIEFFDPTLSYEITGYRPITKEKGLDFDPKLFTVAADTYRKNGKYTSYVPDTFVWRLHWTEEFNRCHDGLTIGKYRLTGENYFFLNYYRLLSVVGDGKGGEVRQVDFPAFIAKQYEYFHYLELVRALKMDGLAFKSRGVGASEIAASNCACSYTIHKNSYNIVTAVSDDYVDTTLLKVWQELDFLNTCTEGAFRHVRMKIDTNMMKRASKVDKDGNESGWMSTIEGITSDKPGKLRGNRCDAVYFEEAGNHTKLIDTYIQGRALVDILGARVGSRFVFGTANGENNPNLVGLKKMFYNPKDYYILPYKHNFTRNHEIVFTGYFIPAYTMWFGSKENRGFDSRGVVDEERAKKYYEDFWATIKDAAALQSDKAEYCFTPEDAFIMEGSNAFNMEKLADQQMNIDQGLVAKPEIMRLKWSLDDEGRVDRHSKPIPEFGNGGHIQIIEKPITDQDGTPYLNLYVGGIDGIDTSSDTTTGLTDLSKFCIVIYKRAFGIEEPKVVALYKYRPNQVQDAWDEAIKLAQYYNAKMLVEATRVGVIEHFKKHGLLYYLMHKPRTITSGRNKNQYGSPADVKTIERELLLINDYIENYYTQICFPEMVDEFLRYSFENKRKFDIVAAFGQALLADEEICNKAPIIKRTTENATIKKLGYYTNEYGLIEFGVKPSSQSDFQKSIRYEGY